MSKWTQRELSLIKKFSDKLKLRFNNVSRAWHHVNSKLGITGKISTKEVRSIAQALDALVYDMPFETALLTTCHFEYRHY
jgi:hypothetical protein